jgi:hypothetical protein
MLPPASQLLLYDLRALVQIVVGGTMAPATKTCLIIAMYKFSKQLPISWRIIHRG